MPARPLRTIVASSDPELRDRATAALREGGATSVRHFEVAIDAMEACFESEVDLAVLDEDLSGVRGSEIAVILQDVGQDIESVVVVRSEGQAPPRVASVHWADPGFDAALAALARAIRLTPREEEG